MNYMAEQGARSGSAAMETMELDNGGMARSLNGNLRHPYIASYRIFGEHGSIEADTGSITVYRYDKEFRYDITRESVPYTPFLHRSEKVWLSLRKRTHTWSASSFFSSSAL